MAKIIVLGAGLVGRAIVLDLAALVPLGAGGRPGLLETVAGGSGSPIGSMPLISTESGSAAWP